MLHLNDLRMRAVSLAAVACITSLPAVASAQSGSARAAFVSTATTQTSVASAVLPSGGGYDAADADAVGVAGLLGAKWGSAVTSGMTSTDKLGVQSVASLADVNILAGKVSASSVIAVARVAQEAGGSVADGEGSSISDLVVNGVSYNADATANNTRINLPGTGYVVIKEVVQGASSVTVNMIHVVLTAPFTGLKIGEIVVGTAKCSSGS